MKPRAYEVTLTPKQRAKLKALANPISQRYLLGKAEPDDGFVSSIEAALEAKELIKVGLLQSCTATPDDVAATLQKRTGCHIVQVIGRVIVIYRRSKKHPTIKLD